MLFSQVVHDLKVNMPGYTDEHRRKWCNTAANSETSETRNETDENENTNTVDVYEMIAELTANES